MKEFTVTVRIDPVDIKRGKRCDSCECPLSLALVRYIDIALWPEVGIDEAVLYDSPPIEGEYGKGFWSDIHTVVYKADIPDHVRRWVSDYDWRGDTTVPEPFDLTFVPVKKETEDVD